MVMRKIWIIFASIVCVALIVATSVDAVIEADVNVKKQLETASGVSADSGRIGLDEKADAEIKSEITSVDAITEVDVNVKEKLEPASDVRADSGRIGLDEKADAELKSEITSTSPADEITSTTEGDSDTGVTEIDDNQNENEPSVPSSDGLIWLAVEGDEIPDDNSESPDFNSDGPGDPIGTTLSATVSGSYATSPTIEVDEVFVASDSGLVNKEVSIDTTLPLNIVGRAEVEVLSGSENLVEGPYFNGLDIVDRLSLAVASASIMFLIRAIQLLDVAFPLVDAIVIATTVYTWVINGTIHAIQNGLDFLDDMIDIGITITIGGHTYTLPGTIRNALKSLIGNILSVLESFLGKMLENLLPLAEQSIDNIIDYLEGLRDDLFGNPDFKALFGQLYSNAYLAVYVILQVLERKDTSDIEAYFEQIGLSHSVAQTLVSLLNSYDNIFVSIRDGIFGKFDLFTTYGRDSTSLRSVHAQINPYCQVAEGSYAAIIKIKAVSAGQVFDSKIIGIIYDGSGYNIPGASENLNTLPGSTVVGSTMGSTSFGSTAMDSTAQTTGLQ